MLLRANAGKGLNLTLVAQCRSHCKHVAIDSLPQIMLFIIFSSFGSILACTFLHVSTGKCSGYRPPATSKFLTMSSIVLNSSSAILTSLAFSSTRLTVVAPGIGIIVGSPGCLL